MSNYNSMSEVSPMTYSPMTYSRTVARLPPHTGRLEGVHNTDIWCQTCKEWDTLCMHSSKMVVHIDSDKHPIIYEALSNHRRGLYGCRVSTTLLIDGIDQWLSQDNGVFNVASDREQQYFANFVWNHTRTSQRATEAATDPLYEVRKSPILFLSSQLPGAAAKKANAITARIAAIRAPLPPSPSSSSHTNMAKELIELGKMFKDGLLTNSEFLAAKKSLL